MPRAMADSITAATNFIFVFLLKYLI
jgi:hypothetical protein